MLNIQKGNMYGFITHTWNTVKGKCFHDCSYCYMKRWGNLKEVRFDKKELNTNLGENNFVFVGSSNDMWAENIPDDYIYSTLVICQKYNKNKYLFQTKNPSRFLDFCHFTIISNSSLCITIESNRDYESKTPNIKSRVDAVTNLDFENVMITIEPIMDFDLEKFVAILKVCNPVQINIGADSGNNNLPEPSRIKTLELIDECKKFTTVFLKENLKRIL